MNIFFILRPCSGTVISGYSKTIKDNSLKSHLTKAIIPYKKFKKNYKVDTTGLFEGKHYCIKSNGLKCNNKGSDHS